MFVLKLTKIYASFYLWFRQLSSIYVNYRQAKSTYVNWRQFFVKFLMKYDKSDIFWLSFYSNETEEIEKRVIIYFPKMMRLEVFYQSVNFIWSISTSYDWLHTMTNFIYSQFKPIFKTYNFLLIYLATLSEWNTR